MASIAKHTSLHTRIYQYFRYNHNNLYRLHTISSSPTKSLALNYLTETLQFAEPRARVLLNRFSSPTEQNPQSVVFFLKSIGFTDSHIRTCVHASPRILFSDVETLKPRIRFFQDIGLTGSDLGKFISDQPFYLSNHFEERLKPCVDVIKSVFTDNNYNKKLIGTLSRCNWVDLKQPETRISSNMKYLKECGIVGSQLVMVMSRQPRLFIMGISELKNLVSKVLDMGGSIDSRMFCHALHTVSCLSDETIAKKVDLFRSFGFLEVEVFDMFRRTPGLLRVSEAKLKLGLEFFMNTVKFDKKAIVRRPLCLMYSLEGRVIPRYRVLNLLTLKGLLKKKPKFNNVLSFTEVEFSEKFISKYKDAEEELLLTYKDNFSGVQI